MLIAGLRQRLASQCVQGPFVELVRSLRVLHLQPQHQQRSVCSSAGVHNSSAGGGSDDVKPPQGDAVADFHRKLAALQEDQESQGSSVNAWLKQPHTAATTTAAAGGSSSSTSWRSSSSSTGGGDEAHLATSTSAADGAEAAAREQEGRVTSSSPLVHPDYGYAVLGGIDPASSQQVAGAQQPKLHPTRNFNVGESYDPLDLSPLAREEEEPWVPQRRRMVREATPGAQEVRSDLHYKNIDMLLKFVSASGRIKPRRQTRLPPRLQSRVARAVKMARQMALIPYEMRVGDGGEGDTWRRMREYRAGMQ